MDRETHKGRSEVRGQRSEVRNFLSSVLVLLCCCLSAWAQLTKPALSAVEGTDDAQGARPSSLVSRPSSIDPSAPLSAGWSDERAADTFFEIASEIANSQDITAAQAEQAIVLLTAAKELGSTNEQIQPLLINLACESAGGRQQDYSQQVFRWLDEYASESIDLEVAKKAIMYLLDRLNSREDRERLLQDLLSSMGGRNAAVDSELYTLLGELAVEKADFKAAQSDFVRAYFSNKYNKLAFSKLAELLPERVGPTIYLEHLRLILRENPLVLETVLAFAQYAERLQLYELAADAYQYSANLFSYLYSDEPLPTDIYLPWLISNYNTAQNQAKCLHIADLVRRSGRFDIFAEAIAGKAEMKIGNIQEASKILQSVESQIANRKSQIADSSAKQFAWFYCFAFQDSAKALDWANRAFSADPNSAITASLLAYALVINQQLEWAKPLIENNEQNQIADLVRAQIQLTDGQREPAIETLRSAIAKDPGSLAAERAKEILAMQGEEYISPVDPNVVLTVLSKNFGQAIVPQFSSPDKLISAQFDIHGNEFPFGNEFSGNVAIINNSSEPLVISDDSIFKGNIQIDANISGDLNYKIPELILHKIDSPSIVEPGKTIHIPLRLVTGQLRRILFSHPQASLDIEFTLYLQIANGKSQAVNGDRRFAISDKVVVKRPGVDITRSSLVDSRSSLEAPITSHESRVKIAELFVALLKEQHAIAEQGTLYRYKYADWMPNLLRSALLNESGLLLAPADNDWAVRVHAMAQMLSLPLDDELISAVAKNLNHTNWPVRMMAVYLLAKNQTPDYVGSGFDKVLSWIAINDSNSLVRALAVALLSVIR